MTRTELGDVSDRRVDIRAGAVDALAATSDRRNQACTTSKGFFET